MRTQKRDQFAMERMNRHEQTMMGNSLRERVRDQSYIKQYNIQSVLTMLRKWQPISRMDISRLTGMSPTSITRIVSALLSQGLVYETTGSQQSGRGRKATNLRINADGLYSVGIHLEKAIVRMCINNFSGESLYRSEALVDNECTPERMAAQARELYDRIPEGIITDRERVCAVGVSLPGAVNTWKGIVNQSDQLEWTQVDLGRVFSEAFGMTACIENDVKACLIGEKARMEIPDMVDTAYLMIGGGIGLAMTSGGVMVRGEHNEAGEIARIPVGYGEDNFLSKHLAEAHLIRQAQERAPSVHTLEAILWAQQQGQPWAEEIMKEFDMCLGVLMSIVFRMMDPAHIILGGSTIQKMASRLEPFLQDGHVCLGDQYDESCVLGAGLIAMRCAVTELIGQSIE